MATFIHSMQHLQCLNRPLTFEIISVNTIGHHRDGLLPALDSSHARCASIWKGKKRFESVCSACHAWLQVHCAAWLTAWVNIQRLFKNNTQDWRTSSASCETCGTSNLHIYIHPASPGRRSWRTRWLYKTGSAFYWSFQIIIIDGGVAPVPGAKGCTLSNCIKMKKGRWWNEINWRKIDMNMKGRRSKREIEKYYEEDLNNPY